MPTSTFSSSPLAREHLLAAKDRYITAFANNKTHPLTLLAHFSTTSPISIQHYPSSCTHPQSSLLRGPGAVRSYYDLLATHWTRSSLRQDTIDVDVETRTIVLRGSVAWTWKKSGRSWMEEFTCTLVFDEALKILSYAVRTDSATKTCVMRAKDVDESPQPLMNANNGGPGRVWVRPILTLFVFWITSETFLRGKKVLSVHPPIVHGRAGTLLGKRMTVVAWLCARPRPRPPTLISKWSVLEPSYPRHLTCHSEPAKLFASL